MNQFTLPIDYLSYTIEDELILSNATSTEAVFLGWFDNSLGAGLPITKIRAEQVAKLLCMPNGIPI